MFTKIYEFYLGLQQVTDLNSIRMVKLYYFDQKLFPRRLSYRRLQFLEFQHQMNKLRILVINHKILVGGVPACKHR